MELSQYVLEVLRSDEEFVLYRGEPSHQSCSPSVLLLVPASKGPALETLRKIEHEYSLRDQLDSAWAVRSLALSEHHGQTTLVLEDPGGEPLDRLLPGPMQMPQFLRLAVGLATALGGLHKRELIHKNVKPANVLVDPATDQVRLMGFGIASRRSRERQAPEPPEFIVGTLPYMAPEQTGRMNRSIDSRSDLYALGVTLYEMLTGNLPFTASDPIELVHCHIAKQPTPPGVTLKGIPDPVSAIIMKLLAKTAEDRYQTSVGVESDLRRCLAEWETQRRVDEFPLGEHDTPDRLLIPEKLYGRESEIEILLAAFNRIVAGGRAELVLVSGYSGIGKSSVVNELHKPLVPPRGLFASGKFDQYKRDIPYATLAQAFQSLVRTLLGQSETEIGRWRDALSEALGPNGQLIVNLVPELELVIGKQPPAAELPPQDAQRRFQMVFRRFLGVFARKEHPLALFLDDLQWLDAATLDLLESVIADAEVRNLLVVGAYRNNEVGPAHPLLRTVESIRKTDARVHGIVLAPLGLDDIGRLVADALHCEPESARPLARLVHEKTGGNPFFTIQFFTELADEGLLSFDPVARVWQWNMDRIRAKNYTDNVVEFISGKLKRFSATTQEALKQLACLGNVVEIATLTLALRETEEAIDAALAEAVHAGVVFQRENAYKFLHDRIQQAAYSLVPEGRRAEVHLRIGRALLASMTADQLAEHLFDVADQLNRGTGMLIERDEKAQVAAIDLRAGCKAKASAAYASARAYFVAGMALLDESDWGSHHELTFSLWLERTECEILSGNFEKADQLIMELLQRAASNVEFARASCLKVDLHTVKGEYPQAVDSALTCLRLFGIDLPAHPTTEQLQTEYETVWQTLDGRPIESLIDLPPMRDPELQAVMQVLSFLVAPAYFTDRNLWCLQTCRMVSVSMQHGTSGASAYAYGLFGMILGRTFHRYREGYRLGRFACDLVEKYGFISSKAKVYSSMGLVAFWTQPIVTAIDFTRACFRTAIETGDQTFACYGLFHFVTGLLLRNDPLDAVRRESEMALDFVRKTRYGDVADIILNQQRFIATMQGRSATFSTFSDAQFDEAAFEAQLIGDRMPMMSCYYWIGKLKARFLSADYAEALAAADKAKAILWGAFDQMVMVDYHCYTALTVAALFENASADGQAGWRALLAAHQEQLREWAESYPPTFADKHALVAAEIARLEGRELDAMRLYEQAIHSARDHGFVQNEALAYEVAARFYAARGFENIANAYLQDARYGYFRWGANGKVQQLDDLYPHLKNEAAPGPTSTIVTPVELLDLATVIKVSQAVSGEMVLEKLIERLMRVAIEHAGAERGLLIVPRADELRIEAEATTTGEDVTVHLPDGAHIAAVLPESLVRYVGRTHENVILDDASARNPFSVDPYIVQHRARSILCLPLINQAKLSGLLYLENNLTPHVFTSERITVLKVLASQAASSLENARLYRDLADREGKIRRLVDANILGIFIWNLDGAIVEANEAFLHMLDYNREDLVSGRARWTDLTPAEWRERDERAVTGLKGTGTVQPYEKEYLRKDGSRVPVLVGGALFQEGGNEGVAFVLDLSDQKRTEEALRSSETYLAEAQRLSHTGSWAMSRDQDIRYWSEECYRVLSFDPQGGLPQFEDFFQRIHPDDQPGFRDSIQTASREKADWEADYRIVHPDGLVRDIHVLGHPVLSTSGDLVEYVGTVIDVTERKRAEEGLRRSETELRQMLDLVPQLVAVFGTRRERLYANRIMLDYVGITLEEWLQRVDRNEFLHPDDREQIIGQSDRALSGDSAFELEMRLRKRDGSYRWFLVRYNPLRDERRQVARWYVAATDIEDRKRAEEKLQQENVALREEIDKTSMFEEIVGASPALTAVLSRVSKVAATDSTVLITGETGTGKELVARAIHKQSRRSSRAFVAVNCAAIPRELIASELFGHEKGAFTGATQRRLGRFELADGGTIFLDEVGELLPDTQVALLRVLQEREFERVGGTQPIQVDVRVIAATNRDLNAAAANGTFRQDLFYRLNVFPLEMPPLRERKADIPVLVEYFIDRFARKAGKALRRVNKRTLEHLQSYPWPGNVRELQNVIERSVILCETDEFTVDESWLSAGRAIESRLTLSSSLATHEKAIIEEALRASNGQVFGPAGAAARLGMPRSTLESKIRALGINKNRFRPLD